MAELETGDKSFNRSIKQAAWFIGLIISVVIITVSMIRYVKSEVNDSIKVSIQVAIAEILYEVRDFKSIKTSVADHEKAISILTYRLSATEEKLSIPSINKNIRIEELNGGDTRKKQKEVDDNS